MRKLSRRQIENLEQTKKKVYSDLQEALLVMKKTANAKFVETVELHVNLNIDPKYADQQLRTTVTLPHGNGKQSKIAVLTDEENFDKCKSAGADIVGNDDLIEAISSGDLQFDILITMPNFIKKLAKLGRILGPRGLMPSPKSGTVTIDVESAIIEFKKGKFEYKADKTGIVHASVGKSNFSTAQLEENLTALINSIEENRPSGIKGKYLKTMYISSSMGQSYQLDVEVFKKGK